MAELDRITIEGFKSIASIQDLELRDVNVVIGANGSGKSNFLGVFALLHALREGRLDEYVKKTGGADAVLHFGARQTESLRIHISFQGGVNAYKVELAASVTDRLYVREEVASFWDKSRYPRPFDRRLESRAAEAGISDSNPSDPVVRYVREHLGRWRLYHFHDTSFVSPMKRTVDVVDNHFLRPDGGNLAAFLYYLMQVHPERYELIRRTVQRVTPFFDDFRLEPERLNTGKVCIEWRHQESDAYFDVAALSDGSLRFIALATLFLQPKELRPSVILVDEPELGLHPYAITMLASLVKQAAVDTQVILSTQSPLLLDHFEPDDVLVAERIDGGTRLRRESSERLQAWLEDYSLGQLWEKNELGGRPHAPDA